MPVPRRSVEDFQDAQQPLALRSTHIMAGQLMWKRLLRYNGGDVRVHECVMRNLRDAEDELDRDVAAFFREEEEEDEDEDEDGDEDEGGGAGGERISASGGEAGGEDEEEGEEEGDDW